MPNLAFILQFHQRADGFLVWDLGVRAVKLVEIDLFDLQSLEAALTGRAQMLGTTVRLPLSWPWPQQPTLGRDHELLRIGVEGLGDQSLADLRPIGIGGVDEVDAELQRAAQHPLALLAIGRLAPDPFPGDTHSAEPKPIDRHIAADVDGSGKRRGDCARRAICHSILLG